MENDEVTNDDSPELHDISPVMIFPEICCFYSLDPTALSSPLFKATMHDDVSRLTALLQEGKSFNINNTWLTPLHVAIKHGKKQVFDLILKLEDICLDTKDIQGGTPLIMAAKEGAEYFALELLKLGVHVNETDTSCSSALHYSCGNIILTEALVAKGAGISIQDDAGDTPLHIACAKNVPECVIFLLLQGADPHILNYEGYLPFTICLFNANGLLELLYHYTFDEHTNQISLQTLTVAMLQNLEYFNILLGKHVVFETNEMEFLYKNMYKIDPSVFYLFMKKYESIVHELVFHHHRLIIQDFSACKPGSKEIFMMLCENEFFVNYTHVSCCYFCHNIITEDTFCENLLYLLSYGFSLTETDLQAIYTHYGFGKLFKMLLHMEIREDSFKSGKSLSARLIYDIHMKIDVLLNCDQFVVTDFDLLLKFFAHPVLAEYSKRVYKRELSPVPSLVELSRNCARKNIIEKFRVKNCSQFFTVLKWLPVNDVYKKILSYEKPIYS